MFSIDDIRALEDDLEEMAEEATRLEAHNRHLMDFIDIISRFGLEEIDAKDGPIRGIHPFRLNAAFAHLADTAKKGFEIQEETGTWQFDLFTLKEQLRLMSIEARS